MKDMPTISVPPPSRPAIRDISWQRWVAFSVGSLISGMGWAGIALMLFGVAPYTAWHHLLCGAVSGLLVGWIMNGFYRSSDPTAIALTSPFAYYLGVYFYFVLLSFWRPTFSPNIFLITIPWALYAFAPPFVALLPLSWLNGVLLRWVLLGIPRVKD